MQLPRSLTRPTIALLCLLSSTSMLRADDLPLEPLQIGQPTKLEVHPATVKLNGKNATAQLVVTGHYADGSMQDLTRAATITSSNNDLVIAESAILRGKTDGNAEITIAAGGQQVKLPVEITHAATPARLSFEFDALVALSKNGCNSGACHGSPSGKGGFRLSLRAFDPVLDNLTLIREDLGRRTNKVTADESLLLLKPLMKVPHGGGQKMKKSDPAYAVLRDWIEQGCNADPADQARCVKIEVSPPTGRQFKFPAHTQQLAVRAHFSDGTSRDVTPLACYSSSDTEVAEVTEAGLVIGKNRGEAAILVRYLEHIESVFLTFVKDIPGYQWPNPPTNNYIDELVNVKLRQLQYLPSGLCSDEEFLRRAYCDVIGTPPTVDEVRAFLADGAPDKRAKAINALLDRPEYARFWALKWGDLLRLTNQQIGNSGMFKYHRWVERALATNMPYDQFAKELLVASGSTLENPAANFYRTAGDTNECVETISQVFLGARLQCAKCHNHPFERWTQDNYYGMAAFFNRVQRKKSARPDELVVYMARGGEVTQPRTNKQMKPWLPQRGDVDPPADSDRRDTFANWLIEKENPYFAKIEVNRLWSHLLGRGIVEPADDFRESNPPSIAALLDALAKDFVEHNYDRKHILRTILNSRTYQADFRPNDMNKDDVKYFSHYQPRLLSAEQLLDSICAVTDLPETFAGLPVGTKATQLPSPDLAKHEFLKIFGQPERQTVCACERTSDSNLGMAIQFFNGPLIYGKLRDANNRFRKAITAGKKNEDIIEDLYLAAVSRRPTPKELEASLTHIASKGDQVVGLEDVCWALLNTNEFLFQH
ncbi:Bacterial Ig-like domain (group 2) [Anatilimnocola aggregata]|uniref:Bacterial Ig-like domain (Group 2) n=1 Tax=Anatilimnocola aggregata TaxID=2528021 RepID=A0A517YCR1_9BACT|nr:DUF1549 domain-containing protein [Anatilimnocola aggregata]QDU27979.1 Bacterial Ig-like domain (group 2) [Anatilimnocola aggregata]